MALQTGRIDRSRPSRGGGTQQLDMPVPSTRAGITTSIFHTPALVQYLVGKKGSLWRRVALYRSRTPAVFKPFGRRPVTLLWTWSMISLDQDGPPKLFWGLNAKSYTHATVTRRPANFPRKC